MSDEPTPKKIVPDWVYRDRMGHCQDCLKLKVTWGTGVAYCTGGLGGEMLTKLQPYWWAEKPECPLGKWNP